MKMKNWFYEKMMTEVCKYGDLWMDISTVREDTVASCIAVDADGYVTITSRVEVLKETDKAIYININDAWKTWCPKSVVIL